MALRLLAALLVLVVAVMSKPQAHPSLVYRIVTGDEWKLATKQGFYEGAALDKKDGYLHMSTWEETGATLTAYFKGVPNVELVEINLDELPAENVRWDYVAARGSEFPHLYNQSLPVNAKVTPRVWSLPMHDDGSHDLPQRE